MAPPEPAARIPPGSMLAHFRIEESIGEGASSSVFRAWDTGLERDVAIKVLKKEIGKQPEFERRFFHEARASARVNHRNLAQLYYVGREGSRRFFAMELVCDGNLQELVEREGRLSVMKTVEFLVQAAEGLHAAHESGLVHRDVKPANLVIGHDGHLKLMDFGIARPLDSSFQTKLGQILGTPACMSPEQCRGAKVSPASDLYSLGMTAWYLLIGRWPFQSESLADVLQAHLRVETPPLAEFRNDVPPALEQLVAKMCSKAPKDRPASAKEVAETLRGVLQVDHVLAPARVRFVAGFLDLATPALAGMSLALAWPGGLSVAWMAFTFALLFGASQIVPEALLGGTLGKWLVRIQVASSGSAPGLRCTALRFLGQWPCIPVLLLAPWLSWGWVAAAAVLLTAVSCGCGWSLLLRRGETYADRWSNTTVIYEPSLVEACALPMRA